MVFSVLLIMIYFAHMKKLAPQLCRQRVVIELLVDYIPTKELLEQYLVELSHVSGMTPVDGPYIYPCGEKGFGGWIHWTTSGAHVYSYPPEKTGFEKSLVTVDSYTCKPFDVKKVTSFTTDYFGVTADEHIEVREV